MVKEGLIIKRTRYTAPVAGIEVTVELQEEANGGKLLSVEIGSLRMLPADWQALKGAVDQLVTKAAGGKG